MRAAIVEARTHGMRVAAHAIGTNGIKNALRAGVTSIEHGHLLDDEAIALFKERGAYLVPTLAAVWCIYENIAGGAQPDYVVRKATEIYQQRRRQHPQGVARRREDRRRLGRGHAVQPSRGLRLRSRADVDRARHDAAAGAHRRDGDRGGAARRRRGHARARAVRPICCCSTATREATCARCASRASSSKPARSRTSAREPGRPPGRDPRRDLVADAAAGLRAVGAGRVQHRARAWSRAAPTSRSSRPATRRAPASSRRSSRSGLNEDPALNGEVFSELHIASFFERATSST